MAEIQADKDQLRAEFAMSTRRLEMSVDQLKNKSTSQLADLGKKNDVINRLKIELGEKAATIFALEARDRGIKDQLRATEDELGVKTTTLRETERNLADKEAELAKATAGLSEQTATSDSQRVEIVALKTQVETLKDQVAGLDKDVKTTEERYAREKEAAEKATKELTEERGTVANLGTRIGQFERQLATQTTEAEIMGRRIADMEMRLTEQSRLLADRERERDQLRTDLDSARRIEADLRQELGTIDRRHGTATEALRAEKTLAESQLERAREDRAKLQRELSSLKREAESSWASERVENALLRERINDVAAEVARLTSALEGPGSAIDTILAAPEHAPGGNGGAMAPAQPANTNAEDKGSLADRIRALQARSSRLSSAT
jgi:chromosome segregation ATPase